MSDREKLVELLNEHYLTYRQSTNSILADYLVAKCVVVQEHGRWENIVDCGGACWGYCSVCRTEHKARNATALRAGYKYCPNCGAKME